MRKFLPVFLTAALLLSSDQVWTQGNTTIESFAQAKRLLENKVYYDHRETFYCRAVFDAKKNVTLPQGFVTEKHAKRAKRVEWEHVVPAENFGRFFSEWRDGHESCVKNGKPFKGRSCAEKASRQFRFMQADLYNLYPAIGAVNALRSNYRFTMMSPEVPVSFGSCPMKISDRAVEPPEWTRGAIARTMLYMQSVYPRYRLSRRDSQLVEAWDKMYPVDDWECLRAERIEQIQGNENPFVKDACRKAGLPRGTGPGR